MTRLPNDFKEFLKLLNANDVDYLIVGGHAVGYHGYPRPTGDIDIWVRIDARTAERIVAVLTEFGFDVPGISIELFLEPEKVVRMGVPPLRIDLLTSVDGVEFEECFRRRVVDEIDGVQVNFISLEDLKINKRAAARHRDLNDLENLP